MLPKIISSDPTFAKLLDTFFNDDVYPTTFRTTQCGYAAVNIVEHEKDITLEIVVPGLKKDQINIDLNNEILTISAEVTEPDAKENYLRKEFRPLSFRRSFTLPDYLDTEKISAMHENGILSVVIEKKEQAIRKGPRQIEIK